MSSLANALDPLEPVVDPLLLEQSQDLPTAEHVDSVSMDPDADADMQPLPSLKVEIPEGSAPADGDPDEEMADLFGEEDAEPVKRDGTSSPAPSAPGSEALSASEKQHRKELEYEEDEGGEEAVLELKHAVLSIPNIPAPTSSDGNNWVIRMPNFVKLDPKPFHPDSYVGPEQVDEEAHQADTLREKSMSIKLEVENTIRWKWVKDAQGQNRRQSNSRVIRWSDGSLSLLLGKELFDINQAFDNSATVPRQSLGGSQPQSQATPSLAKTQGLTYLVAQHKRPGILQAEAPITGYMTLRPTGMQSETHRMLVRAVGQKHNKVARLRMAPDPTTDPERERIELTKQQARKDHKKGKREDDEMGLRKRRTASSRRRLSDQVWSDEDEQEAVFEGSEDEDEDGFGSSRKTKATHAGDVAGKKSGDYQTDDFVVADTSDEDAEHSDAGGRRKRRRSAADEAGSEVDPLDEADAKIARQQEDRRRNRQSGPQDSHESGEPGKGKDKDEDEEMDVESEEEEEEDFKVRRAGAGSRKKRAIDFDDDDDE